MVTDESFVSPELISQIHWSSIANQNGYATSAAIYTPVAWGSIFVGNAFTLLGNSIGFGGSPGGGSRLAQNNGLPTPTLLKATIPGTHYCGPGGNGAPSTQADAACAAHDLCYQNAGVSFLNNIGWPKTAQQTAAIQACDANLCRTLGNMSWPTSVEVGQATFVSTFFGCSNGYSLRP